MFKPTPINTTVTPNTFTAQDAGIYSNAELDRVLFAKYSDTTLQLLGTSISYHFITVHNEQHSNTGSNLYNNLKIGLPDHLLRLPSLLNPDWFSTALTDLFWISLLCFNKLWNLILRSLIYTRSCNYSFKILSNN